MKMRTIFIAGCLLFSLTTEARDTISVGSAGRYIDDSFFGMHVRYGAVKDVWPNTFFASWRVITPETTWRSLQPSRNQWDFSTLDKAVEKAMAHHVDVLLTLGQTPAWASARPNEIVDNGRGASSEPAQLADWENYIRTVAKRYKGRIKYYELWNEPKFRDIDSYKVEAGGRVAAGFTGYTSQMVEMGKVAQRVISQEDLGATLISPGFHCNSVARIESWLKAGGGQVAPVLASHFYVLTPEKMIGAYRAIKSALDRSGNSEMPIWNTESGYLVENPERPAKPQPYEKVLSPEKLAAYMVRSHLLAAALGVSRFYWYSWDIRDMGLTRSYGATPMIGAVAYGTMTRWLRGATVSKCETANDKTWLCYLSQKQKKFVVLWNANEDIDFVIPDGMYFNEIESIEGHIAPLSGRKIRIGMTPQRLGNSSSPATPASFSAKKKKN